MPVAPQPSVRYRNTGAGRSAALLWIVWVALAGAGHAGAEEPGRHVPVPKLEQIEKSEKFMRSLGFDEFRVRYHGNIARIEVPEEDLPRLLEAEMRAQIVTRFKEIGFDYVTADLKGFRSGAMDEILKDSEKSIGKK